MYIYIYINKCVCVLYIFCPFLSFYCRHNAKVALVEKSRLGGTCVNVGCVPKKVIPFDRSYIYR